MNLVGSVEGKNAIIIDDMIDTAGTLCEAAKTLKSFGALSVSSFATHGLFSGKAFENIKKSVLENIVVTNTTPSKPGEAEIDTITRLSVGKQTTKINTQFDYFVLKFIQLLFLFKCIFKSIYACLNLKKLLYSLRQSTESRRSNL